MPERFTFLNMVRSLVQHTILKSCTKDAQNFVVHPFIPFKLLIRLKNADIVIGEALINGGHTTELLMIPRVHFLIRHYDRFWKGKR